MARGGGGRGRKVVVNSGKWQTVTKSSTTNANDDSDEEVTKKMTDADWNRYFEIMDEMQVIFVKQGEQRLKFLYFRGLLILFSNILYDSHHAMPCQYTTQFFRKS